MPRGTDWANWLPWLHSSFIPGKTCVLLEVLDAFLLGENKSGWLFARQLVGVMVWGCECL